MITNTKETVINLHRMQKESSEIHNGISVENAFDEEKGTLGLVYTPGVVYVAAEISNNKELVYDYTSKWKKVAIICGGTGVLDLGNIGLKKHFLFWREKSVSHST